jgi:hypothetical protein
MEAKFHKEPSTKQHASCAVYFFINPESTPGPPWSLCCLRDNSLTDGARLRLGWLVRVRIVRQTLKL